MSLAVFFSALIALLVCLNPSLTLATIQLGAGTAPIDTVYFSQVTIRI